MEGSGTIPYICQVVALEWQSHSAQVNVWDSSYLTLPRGRLCLTTQDKGQKLSCRMVSGKAGKHDTGQEYSETCGEVSLHRGNVVGKKDRSNLIWVH